MLTPSAILLRAQCELRVVDGALDDSCGCEGVRQILDGHLISVRGDRDAVVNLGTCLAAGGVAEVDDAAVD